MTTYYRARISATSKKEANTISKELVKKKLVAGTMIYKGKCHYWWNNKINEKTYWNIGAFTLNKNKEVIINEVKKIHKDECPIIAFTEIDGNKEFLKWIEDSIQ